MAERGLHARAGQAAVARALGQLMLSSLDVRQLRWLQSPGVEEVFSALGVPIPPGAENPRQLEEQLTRLAREFRTMFRGDSPEHALCQSSVAAIGLHRDPVICLRAQARTIDVELETLAGPDVPLDHIGVILLLWAAAVERDEDVANHIASHHLGWAGTLLGPIAMRGGFYGGVAFAVRELTRELAPAD